MNAIIMLTGVRWRSLCLFVITLVTCIGLFVTVASAHVKVTPTTSTTGAWQKYTISVPTEKDVPTTKLVLKVPAGVEIEQYEPVAGWQYSVQKGTNDQVQSVTWTATGEGILPGQFQEFSFVAKNPSAAGTILWDAFQYYKDGSIVEWTGDESSETPHSTTTIATANATGAASTTPPAPGDGTAAAPQNGNSTLLWVAVGLSVVSLILSIVSLIARRRPGNETSGP